MKKHFLQLFLFVYTLPLVAMDSIVATSHIFRQPPEVQFQLQPIRKQLDSVLCSEPDKVVAIDPTIVRKVIPLSERRGVCYNHAIVKTFNKYGITRKFKVVGCQDWIKVLPFFKGVKRIKPGDLVIFFNEIGNNQKQIVHFGTVDDPQAMRIESKFGTILESLFIHWLFSLPSGWGDNAVAARLKKKYRTAGIDQANLILYIQLNMENDMEIKQTLFTQEFKLLSLAQEPIAEDGAKWKIVQMLEQFPVVSVDVRNSRGETPLIIATKFNNARIVEALLAYGANKYCIDMYARTALDIARTNGNVEIQRLLT